MGILESLRKSNRLPEDPLKHGPLGLSFFVREFCHGFATSEEKEKNDRILYESQLGHGCTLNERP